MTEMAEGSGQNSGMMTAPSATTAPSTAHEAPQAAPVGRSFSQSEVDDIVKRAKNEAVDRYRRLNVEQPAYAQQKYGEAHGDQVQQPPSHQSFDMSNVRQAAAEEARRYVDQARQDALRQSHDDMAKRTVQNFFAKTGKGREKYQDFDQVTGDVELGRFPNVVQLLGDFIENSDDVFYELGKDRIKLSQLEALAERSPNDAVTAVKRLAESIKNNAESARARTAKEPLSQVRPSNYGTDTGALSVSDYRKKYKG